MKVILNESCTLKKEDISDKELEVLKDYCTHRNSVYDRNLKLNISIYNTPEFYRLYTEDDKTITVPRGIVHWLQKRHKKMDIVEHYNVVEPIKYKSNIVLRPEQQRIFDAVKDYNDGVYCAPCGSGKTVVGIKLIEEKGCRTLIIVHTRELLEQWKERIKQFFGDLKIGIIGDGEYDIQPLTIGLMQTIVKRIEDVKDEFDMIIGDEIHHAPCTSIYSILNAIPAKYKYGTTATPERKDKKEFMLYASVGPIRYDMAQDSSTLIPQFYVVETGFDFPYYKQDHVQEPVFFCKTIGVDTTKKCTECKKDATPDCMIKNQFGNRYKCKSKFVYDKNYTHLTNLLYQSKNRNSLIYKYICYCYNQGYHILALFDRVDIISKFSEALSNVGIESGILIGAGKDNEGTIERFKEEKIRILLGTKVADEGLDLPILDTVILTGPCVSNPGLLQQRMGRCTRPYPGKTGCRVIYLYDVVFQYQRRILLGTHNGKIIKDFSEIRKGS